MSPGLRIDGLQEAFDTALGHLVGLMRPEGYWEGRLSSSALSTATALSALSLARIDSDADMIRSGVEWLARTQCADGGWGDTPDSPSNLSTTLLAASALTLASDIAPSDARARAQAYIAERAGTTSRQISSAIQKIYGADRTFAVPILMNCALAGLVDWHDVPGLPFELAVFPRSWYKTLRLQVVSYALPALIAVGLTINHHNPPRNPLTSLLRRAVTGPVLRKLATLQPENGGFLEATPLTTFVAMSLIPVCGADQPVVEKCLDFARASQREDGSWPIDTNLSTWVTSCAVAALSGAGALGRVDATRTSAWLAERQYQEVHPFTGAAPGGWGWTHLPGGVPDADDTSGAILALGSIAAHISSSLTPAKMQPCCEHSVIPSPLTGEGQGEGDLVSEGPAVPFDKVEGDKIAHSTFHSPQGIQWLLDLQNTDGGWPTFCRGWGKLPFDKSSPDITAHALRALKTAGVDGGSAAVRGGLAYLAQSQRTDGSWVPLWFGNQTVPDHKNPVFGTARVLPALADWQPESSLLARGIGYLISAQNEDGGWGGDRGGFPSSIEESALSVIALSRFSGDDSPRVMQAVARGASYLIECVKQDTWRTPSPIGLYFASLWYSEEMYPVAWSVEALGRVLRLAGE